MSCLKSPPISPPDWLAYLINPAFIIIYYNYCAAVGWPCCQSHTSALYKLHSLESAQTLEDAAGSSFSGWQSSAPVILISFLVFFRRNERGQLTKIAFLDVPVHFGLVYFTCKDFYCELQWRLKTLEKDSRAWTWTVLYLPVNMSSWSVMVCMHRAYGI